MDEDYKPWLDAMLPHIHRYLELPRLHTEYLDIFFQRGPAVHSFFVERTPFNSNHVDLDLNEKRGLISPSKTVHQTIRSASDDDRISLVSDIALVLEADSACEKHMPAFSLWKKL